MAPTATSEAAVARVDGAPITLSEFDEQLGVYQASAQGVAEQDARAQVLDHLIEQKVVEQAALENGHQVSQAEVEAEVQAIIDRLGGPASFADYLAANGYSEAGFRAQVASQLLGSRMLAAIAEQVPESSDQVHARHILVDSEGEAEQVLAALESGTDFATLAATRSRDLGTRSVGGDLGWFPRGWLTVAEVETAAFDLPVQEISGIVRSALGYHIVQPLERDTRPLAPDVLQALRLRAVQDWLDDRLAGATIEILLEN